MIDFHDDFFCEECGHRDSSSVGDPRYSFGIGRKEVLVCKNCYDLMNNGLSAPEKENDLDEAA